MGVPQSTGKTADMNTFKEAAVIHDAPDGPADISALKNPHGAGTDSAVGGAAPTGTLDIAGAPVSIPNLLRYCSMLTHSVQTSNIPSELRQT